MNHMRFINTLSCLAACNGKSSGDTASTTSTYNNDATSSAGTTKLTPTVWTGPRGDG